MFEVCVFVAAAAGASWLLPQWREERLRSYLLRRLEAKHSRGRRPLVAVFTLTMLGAVAPAGAQVQKLGLDAPRLMTDACRSYVVDAQGRHVPVKPRTSGQLCAVLEGSPIVKGKPKPATGRALMRLFRRGLTLTYAVDERGCVLIAPWGAMVDPGCRWERTESGAYVLRPGRRGSGDSYFVPGVTVREPAWAKTDSRPAASGRR